jgi:hypothetical protein
MELSLVDRLPASTSTPAAVVATSSVIGVATGAVRLALNKVESAMLLDPAPAAKA